MGITAWPTTEQPREKLINLGATSLSDAELLAIILATGVKNKNVLELSRHLLDDFDGLRGVLNAPQDSLCQVSGLGSAKFAKLSAVKELGDRYRLARVERKHTLGSAVATKTYLKAKYASLDHEVFSCLYLDSQHHLLRIEEVFTGTIDGAAVYPREVVKRCLQHKAAAVIFAHNHPSGVAEPSRADIAITEKLKSALNTVDIRVLDHLIVGDPNVTSMAERGLI